MLFALYYNLHQLSSCFLLGTEDSVEGLYKTASDMAKISKWAGGIGLHVHNVRAKNSVIRGTNGISNGLMPMLKVYNDTARYIDQCIHPNTYIYTNHDNDYYDNYNRVIQEPDTLKVIELR